MMGPWKSVIEPPQKWGVRLPRSYQGILDEVRICKYNIESIQYHNYAVKVKLLHICFRYWSLQEMKLERILQKISKSNHLALEVKTFFGTLHQWQAPSHILALKAWTSHWWPPTASPKERERERERERDLHTTRIQKAQSLSDYA
jgi:hypothetical protein